MDDSLTERILAFELDAPAAQLSFTSRLAREQGWSHVYAGRVVMEYKRFLVLAMTAGHPVTPSEAAGTGLSIVLPMAALMAVGMVKVVVGFAREKPVMFLVLFLLLTFIAMIVVASARKKLTPQGEALLVRMRAMRGDASSGSSGATLCAVALGGITAAAGDPLVAGIDHSIRQEIAKVGQSTGSGGDGSGCGASGCGSSGCGGCGGCGGGD